MKTFMKSFHRHADGSWECISPAEFNGPSGRIQVAEGSRFTPGTNFMGVDLALLLEEQWSIDDRQP
jgi:hypothetical protein